MTLCAAAGVVAEPRMGKEGKKPENESAQGTDQSSTAEQSERSSWKELWQVPLFLGAGILLVSGFMMLIATKPKQDVVGMLDHAQSLIDHQQYKEGLDYINDQVRPFVARDGVPDRLQSRYNLLLARSLYQSQKDQDLSVKANHEQIVRNYNKAERLGATLEPRDEGYLSQTYLALGDDKKALERVQRLPDEDQKQRIALEHQIVESLLDQPNPDYDKVLSILAQMLDESELPRSERVWVVARQNEVRLSQGFDQEAIDQLLHTIARLADTGVENLGELYMLLGQAYLKTGDLEQSERNLTQAQTLVSGLDPIQAKIGVALGDVIARAGRPEEARSIYLRVIEQFDDIKAAARARVGLSDVQATMAEHDEAYETLTRVVNDLKPDSETRPAEIKLVTQKLQDRFEDRFGAGDVQRAKAFAELGIELYNSDLDRVPAPLLLAMAQAHRRLADDAVGVSGDEESSRGVIELSLLDAATREVATLNYNRAGNYFKLHALSAVMDSDNKYADSLWMSADSFDRGGFRDEAVETYREFVDGLPNDPRRPQAIFQLGQVYQARGDYDLAAQQYKQLIQASTGVGIWRDSSYVPLAQTYLLDEDPANDPEAERLLRGVVSGTLGGIAGPDAEQFPEALRVLGYYYYVNQRYPEAIARLREALDRGTDEKYESLISFRLADALRLEAEQIAITVRGAMPEVQKRKLIDLRVEHLKEARTSYEHASRLLNKRQGAYLTALENLAQRNSLFYLGDTSFDLGDYQTAIQYYDAARQRYPQDPASLVAMSQIVASYLELGDIKRAMTANERASRFHKKLPDSVWNDPDLPMGRDDWERWIQSKARLAQIRQSGQTGTAGKSAEAGGL